MQSCSSSQHPVSEPSTGLTRVIIITFSFRQLTVLGARHVAVQPRGDVVTGRLQITRATWLPLAPGPELARGVLRARALTRRA